MECPNCGSPVMIYGDRWECGWCGNFGYVSCRTRKKRVKRR